MTVTLQSLDLSDEARACAEEEVRRAAYFKWLADGAPEGDGHAYWVEAERDWIAHCYVPCRADLTECCDERATAWRDRNRGRALVGAAQ